MSMLLEILGRGLTVDISDLIWRWFDAVRAGNGESESQQNDPLTNVINLVAERKYEKATEKLRLYLFEKPDCPHGRLASAAICLQEGQTAQAIEQLNSVYMRNPSNTMALYALGHCYERIGKEHEAVAFYQDCLKFKNHLQLPCYRLAAIYFKNGQIERAIEEYQRLKTEYPDDLVTLVLLGYLYIANEKYEDASEAFNSAILLHPDNFANDDNNEINELVRQEQYYEAVEKIESLLVEYPERLELMVKRGDIFSAMGALEESVSAYEEVISICPDFLEATIKLGTQYLRMDRYVPAAQQFNRAVEINDRIVEAYIGLTLARELAGSKDEAIGMLSLATAIATNSPLLFAETAKWQLRDEFVQDWDESSMSEGEKLYRYVLDAHQQELVHQPGNPDAHYRMGMLLINTGNLEDAVQEFKLALEINALHSRAQNQLEICLFDMGKKEEALDHIASPSRLDKATVELHYKTAVLYSNQIKFASSLLNLEQFMANNFANSNATVNISIILQNLGLLDKAQMRWENLWGTAYKGSSSAR